MNVTGLRAPRVGWQGIKKSMFGTNDWFSWAILSAVFAAFTAILAKVGLKGIDADYATLIRTLVIATVLAMLVVLTKKWRNPFSIPWQASVCLVLSGLATGASWVCYFRALKAGDASKVAPVDKLSVVFVAITAVALLGERPSIRDWIGIALIAFGVIILGLKQ